MKSQKRIDDGYVEAIEVSSIVCRDGRAPRLGYAGDQRVAEIDRAA